MPIARDRAPRSLQDRRSREEVVRHQKLLTAAEPHGPRWSQLHVACFPSEALCPIGLEWFRTDFGRMALLPAEQKLALGLWLRRDAWSVDPSLLDLHGRPPSYPYRLRHPLRGVQTIPAGPRSQRTPAST